MNFFMRMDEKLQEFAEQIPAKGSHLNYLVKACELMELYGEALSIMEEERTPENVAKVEEIAREIEEIVQ